MTQLVGRLIDRIIAFEEGELDAEEIVALFSVLIKTGLINELQGSYGRNAARLIELGYLSQAGDIYYREIEQ